MSTIYINNSRTIIISNFDGNIIICNGIIISINNSDTIISSDNIISNNISRNNIVTNISSTNSATCSSDTTATQ